jgi:transcriptional regulator with XRE-family HTH domain
MRSMSPGRSVPTGLSPARTVGMVSNGRDRNISLGDAIRKACDGHPQRQLAAALGVTQSTISKWWRGEVEPVPSQIDALEIACGRPHGFVFRLAGWFGEISSVEQCLAYDATISDEGKEVILAAYRALQTRETLR